MSGTVQNTSAGYVMSSDQMSFPGNEKTVQNLTQSRVFDTAGWTFAKPPSINLAWMAVIVMIIFSMGVMLKVYKWRRDYSKLRTHDDEEFGYESEVNYGIITPGDKHFMAIDIRSDTTSVYDTVTSFRLIGNGAAIQPSGGLPCQDTVTSYKSLLMQRADGNQYDSVKSYKAFLQRVTQNRDLDVEVKLLENYPVKSKSTEHCYVVEEESSECTRDLTSRFLNFIPYKKRIHVEGKLRELKDYERRKSKSRRPSGDLQPAFRKRSASNPMCRRHVRMAGAGLPPIRHQPQSSDSEEETHQSFMSDRKRMWAERKKMFRSTSTGKISKVSSGMSYGNIVEGETRRRHYSADSVKRPMRFHQFLKKPSDIISENEPLVSTERKGTSKAERKSSVSEIKGDESSSENPTSSHSSCEQDDLSDVMVSDSGDEDTKLNTVCSTASEKTLDLMSCPELGSSCELLQPSPLRLSQVSPSNIPPSIEEENDGRSVDGYEPAALIAGTMGDAISAAKLQDYSNDFNDNVMNNTHSEVASSQPTSHSEIFPGNSSKKPQNSGYQLNQSREAQTNGFTNSLVNGSSNDQYGLGEVERFSNDDFSSHTAADDSSKDTQPHSMEQTSQKVQRFHVTFVKADVNTRQSE